MPVVFLKRAAKTASAEAESVGDTVKKILDEIEAGGEDVARAYAARFDQYQGPLLLSEEEIEAASAQVSQKLKDDIAFAHDNVRRFAERQRDTIQDIEMEVVPGLVAGQRLIPVSSAGCYIPGGRYSHIASAIMTVTTARVAGVQHITACSPPRKDVGIAPAIVHAAKVCGANQILAMGGVQGIASMAFGLFDLPQADILVGPGNQFVAEAKRILFGRVGIDMFAGPTEIAVIADDSADPQIVAEDLVSQAEHGPDSPAWLITTSRQLSDDVMSRMDGLIESLPEVARNAATVAWRDYGEVILCDSDEEAVAVSDEYAAEHLEVHTARDDWYAETLRNYGSLFVGEETTVTYGDKCSGTNHILPTKGAAHYTGGLSVHKYLKVVTTQRMTREANREVGQAAARISRLEGMEAHARAGDARLRKYFPGENLV